MIQIWEHDSYTLRDIFHNKSKRTYSKKLPLISVVIATYRSEETIENCIKSILNQTYPNVEIIIVDAKNYDKKEKEQCRKIIARYKVRYFEDGPERSIQRNRGIKEAKGEYILLLDQDMYLTKDVIYDCFTTIKKGFVALLIPEISIGKGYWSQCVALERYISTYLETGLNECCRFFRKNDALKIEGYDPEIVGAEDSDFHYRMKELGKIGKIKSIIYHDEGRTRVLERIMKKYYYSKAFRLYVKRYPTIAINQFSPLKLAYLNHLDLLFQHPVLLSGIIFFRGGEVLAGTLGLFINR